MVNDWKIFKLSDIAHLYDGPHATPTKTDAGPIFLGISNLMDGRLDLASAEHISDDDYIKWTRRVTPEKDDIVFSYETRLGEAAIIPDGLRCCLGRRMGLLRPKREYVEPRFLLYAYLGPEFQATIRSRTVPGSTVDRISLLEMPDFPIRIPDIETQKGIASLLGAIDEKIDLNILMNKKLEQIAQGVFRSWFIDFDPVRAKAEGRQPFGMDEKTAALFPLKFEEWEMEKTPSGWEVCKILDIAEVIDFVANGSFALLKENVTLLDEPNYAIYIRTTDFCSNFDVSKFKYVDEKAYTFLRKTKLIGNEIIISNVGNVGTVFRAPVWLDKPMTLGSNALLIRTAEYNNYFYFYFTSHIGQESLRSLVSGSAQPKFNKTDFRSLRLVIPPREIIHSFNSIIEPLNQLVIRNKRESMILDNIRKILIPKLFSGEVRASHKEVES